jgi:flagellar biosynthesis protein FlhG
LAERALRGNQPLARRIQRGTFSPARRSRHVIAIGGGRGGVGKTLLSVNLGVYLAQLGRNVVLCDADPHGANLHTMLGLDRSPRRASRRSRQRDELPADQRARPPLARAPSTPGAAPASALGASHWLSQLDRHDADYVVLNLGASLAPPRSTCSTRPTSASASRPRAAEHRRDLRFCRALFARRLRRALMKERFQAARRRARARRAPSSAHAA